MILIKGLQRYQRSKLELEWNICKLGWPWAHGFEPGWSADVSFDLQLWPLISLQPLDQDLCLVRHLKDLFHICLETKAQCFWMTFKVCNHGSKDPYLLHKMGFVDSQLSSTVSFWFWNCIFDARKYSKVYSVVNCRIVKKTLYTTTEMVAVVMINCGKKRGCHVAANLFYYTACSASNFAANFRFLWEFIT